VTGAFVAGASVAGFFVVGTFVVGVLVVGVLLVSAFVVEVFVVGAFVVGAFVVGALLDGASVSGDLSQHLHWHFFAFLLYPLYLQSLSLILPHPVLQPLAVLAEDPLVKIFVISFWQVSSVSTSKVSS